MILDEAADVLYGYDKPINMQNDNKIIEVSRIGVVDISSDYKPYIKVNTDDIIKLITEKINEIQPDTDWENKFAGKVTISVEFFCNCAEKTKNKKRKMKHE